jgi:hypothetical protein
MMQAMAQLVIAFVGIAVLFFMSRWANGRYRAHDRLPMQLGMDGAATWTAPRPMALLFMPMLGALLLTAAVIGTFVAEPRAGQEGLEGPVVLMLALGLVGVHAFHLWIIDRLLRNSDG